MGRPIINAAALRARRPTSSSAAPTRELDGELDEGHTAGTTDKVGAGVEEANEHSELESDDEEDDNGVMDQDEDDEDAEDDDDDDDDDSNQIEEDVMDEDEGQDELQQDADEDLLDGHEGDRPVAEGNPQEVHDDNAEDEESPSREQEEEPMTMEELISVLQSENGDILAAGLHRFHAALRRLAERKVDREISAESDLFREYLKSSPECAELFRIWDFESKNQVEKLQSIVPKVIARAIFASRLVNARATGVTMIRRIVKSYMRIVYRNLSSNRQPVMHGAIVLLSAMSTHTAPCTKELYEAFDFTLKALPTCLKARKESGKQKNSGPGADLRTPYIRFILGFLTLGDAAIKQAVLESKNTIAIFKGVMGDSYGTISLLLSVLQKKVVEDGTISRNVKFTFFNTSTLEQLTKLYARSDRENPNNISEDGESTVADVVHNFLWNLCTIPGKGICNVGPGWFSNPAASKGKSQGGTLLRWLTSLHPHQSLLHQQILLEVLKNCPDLVHLYWEGQSAVSFEPRLSQRWLSNMAVAAKVLALPVPDLVERWQRSTIGLGLPTVSVLADNILPTPLGRLLLGRCLQHSSNTVRHASSYVLGLSMDKFGRVNNQLKELADIEAAEADAANGTNENRWLSLSRQLREEMRRRIPDFQLILLQQNPKERPAISEKKKDDEDSPVLQPVDRAEIEEDPSITPEVLKGEGLKLIRLYQRHFPELVTESRFDYGKLIPADLTSLSEEMQENVLGLLLELKDFKWWNHPAGSNQSHLYSILRHHVSAESPAMAALSKKLIIHFLTNSILFESRDEELECWFLAIHLILDSLPSREAKSTAPVLNWLDEALCAGTRTVYKLVDRLQKLMEQANENMTDREKQSVIHFNETRVQWLSLGGREFDVSSLELSFPFAPAFICCLDGIAAMLKKHMAELSAGWPEKLIQASKFVFFAMSKTLNDTTESILEQGLSACLEREIKDEASVFPIAARLLTHLHMALQNHLLRGARICVCGLTHLLNHARAFHAKAATFSRQRAERRFVCIRNFIFGSPTLLNHFSNAAADLTIAKDLSQLIAHQLEKDNQEMSTILITECFKPYFDYLTETILTFVLDTDENSLPHSNYVAESFTLLRPYFDVKSLDEIVEAFLTSPSKAENFLVMRLAGEALKPGASRQGQGLSESRHLSCTAFRQVISLLPATNMSDVMVKVIYSHSLPKPFFEKDETLMPTFVHNDQGSSLLDIFPLFDESRVTNLFSAVTNTSVQSFFLASSPIHLLSAFRKGASSDLATLAAFTANPAFSSFKSLPPLEQFRPTLLQVLDEIKSDIVTGADVSATTASLNVAVVTKILSENAFAGLREACAAEMLKSLTSAELSRPAEVCSALKIYWEALCVVFDAVPGSADGHRNSAKLAGMTIRVLRLYIKSKKRFAFTGQELNEETTFGFLIEQISLLIQWFKLNDDATQLFLELDGEEDTLIAFFVSCLKYRFQDPRAIQLLVSLLELLYNEKSKQPSLSLGDLLDMIVSHSQFLSSIQPPKVERQSKPFAKLEKSTHASIRLSVIHLLHRVMAIDPARCCRNELLSTLVQVFEGTRVDADREILKILHLYEEKAEISVAASLFKWQGFKALTEDAVAEDGTPALPAAGATAIIAPYSASQALKSIDTVCAARTLHWFPDDERYSTDSESACLYDHEFIIPFVATAILRAGRSLRLRTLVESGGLSIAVMALSSEDVSIRRAGYFVLDHAYVNIMNSMFFVEVDQVLLLLDALKNVVTERSENDFQRIPTIICLFIAQGLDIMIRPDHLLYPYINRFLLQRMLLDLKDIPLFFDLFNSSSDTSRRERAWILQLVASGLRTYSDYRSYKRRHVFELLMSYFNFPLADSWGRKSVIQLLYRASRIPQVLSDLIQTKGLLTFLANCVSNSSLDVENELVLAIPRLTLVIFRQWANGLVNLDENGWTSVGHIVSAFEDLAVQLAAAVVLVGQQVLKEEAAATAPSSWADLALTAATLTMEVLEVQNRSISKSKAKCSPHLPKSVWSLVSTTSAICSLPQMRSLSFDELDDRDSEHPIDKLSLADIFALPPPNAQAFQALAQRLHKTLASAAVLLGPPTPLRLILRPPPDQKTSPHLLLSRWLLERFDRSSSAWTDATPGGQSLLLGALKLVGGLPPGQLHFLEPQGLAWFLHLASQHRVWTTLGPGAAAAAAAAATTACKPEEIDSAVLSAFVRLWQARGGGDGGSGSSSPADALFAGIVELHTAATAARTGGVNSGVVMQTALLVARMVTSLQRNKADPSADHARSVESVLYSKDLWLLYIQSLPAGSQSGELVRLLEEFVAEQWGVSSKRTRLARGTK